MLSIEEITNKDFGRVFKRMSSAFHKNFKDVTWTNNNPDIRLIQVVGKTEVDLLSKMDNLDNVIMLQQCFLTTGVPIETWIELWKKVKLVISFHNLSDYTEEEFNFLRVPIGADPNIFKINENLPRFVKVFATGHVAETECLDKIFEACKRTGNQMLHTGEDFKWDPQNYRFVQYLEDDKFSAVLQRTQYIPGLRLVEGFEAMCIEGAMTGAVPIVPFLQTYDFYKDFCIYIDVDKDIVEQLINIFTREYKPLTHEQILYVRNEFSWSAICHKMYKRIIE